VTFDDLWAEAVRDARARFHARGSPALVALTDQLGHLSFPGALVLLSRPKVGGGRSRAQFLREVSAATAKAPEVEAEGINADEVESILATLFVDRGAPSSTGRSPDVLGLVVKKAVEREGVEASEDEMREVVHLLQTGQFFGDLVDTAGAIFSTIPELPIVLLKDLPKLPTLPLAGLGLFGDLFALLKAAAQVANDLRDGRIDEPPAVMTRLLALLYGFGTVGRVRDLLRRVLAKDNRSVRLALILYARSNGFDIREEQLDVVYDNLLASDAPDLGPVLAEGVEFMKARYGGNELAGVVAALQRGGAPG
jgi:hypothetical protein